MRVRARLLTRCLCVGLSFLAAVTPVTAVAQEALPLVGEVAHPLATVRTDAVGMAPPSPSDSVDLASDESQVSTANPGDGTQGPPPSDATAAVMAARADAKRDISGTKWVLIGAASQLFFPSVFGLYAVNPDPPEARFIGKTPEYTAFYVETWKARTKARRMKHAWIGVGVVWAAVGALFVVCGNSDNGCLGPSSGSF
jgi:hypothetical protein